MAAPPAQALRTLRPAMPVTEEMAEWQAVSAQEAL